jgi:AraC-like DNA-binding protein
MSLITYTPSYPLSQAVHLFWHWENYHPGHSREHILPLGTLELIFNLKNEPMTLYYPEDGYRARSFTGPFIGGPRSCFFLVDTVQPVTLLVAWFKAGSGRLFFDLPAATIYNQHVALEQLWGRANTEAFADALASNSSVTARFQLLERLLLQRWLAAKANHQAIDYALAWFDNTPILPRIAEVEQKIALSPTRFIRLFHDEVGLSPKRYCRLQRFQWAAKQMALANGATLADIALQAGYYDQSHFNNDFQAFAGITPKLFLPQDREHYGNQAAEHHISNRG